MASSYYKNYFIIFIVLKVIDFLSYSLDELVSRVKGVKP
jgi:hypothetical protein